MTLFACSRFGRVWAGASRFFPVAGLAASLLLFDAASGARAWDLSPTAQIHGFASQAATRTTSNNFFGNTDDRTSLEFRELGINGSWRALSQLQLSAQLVARWAGETDEGRPRFDYAFADWSVLSSGDQLWGLRAGRVVNPYGLYNQTRDVAFTRPSIFLPQSIYFDRTRNLALSADGFCLYGEQRTGVGDFFLEAVLGKARVSDEETEIATLGRDWPGDLQSEWSWIGRVSYETVGSRVRAAVTGMRLRMSYDSSGAPLPGDLPDGNIEFRPWIFSLQYNGEQIGFTSEYAIRKIRLQDFGAPIDLETTGESYYVQGTWRFLSAWEAVARYDVLYVDRHDRSGEKYESQRPAARRSYTRFAKDFTVGLRWDVARSWMLRGEAHFVEGTAWIPRVDNGAPSEDERFWNMYSLLLSYRF